MEQDESERQGGSAGIYGLPFVGQPLRRTREFFDEMRPTAEDSRGVAVGKNLVRYAAVTGVAGVAAVVLL